ncbi:Bgt-50584 [Blumeria graminis f. sp. tritici]|uniref:Bgt-50584 n=3 Tax=Blumeria graminis TaxID=34373 RepID=A0A9X9LBD4_BLUGR|nr:Bgt-50584 [Blumeria graminis f. sp. tritici]
MIPCKLSHNTSRATSYFIISVHSSFLIELRPTTLLIAVASASIIMLQLFLSLEVTSLVMSWLTTNDPSCSSIFLHMGHGVKGVREVGMKWYMQI